MKKIFFALLAVVFASPLCYAQQAAMPVKQAQVKPVVESKIAAGKVVSVSLADPSKGTKSEIVVADESGKDLTFLVKATTTIYDSTSATIALEKIKKDDKVKVKYLTSTEGVNTASSIHLVQ